MIDERGVTVASGGDPVDREGIIDATPHLVRVLRLSLGDKTDAPQTAADWWTAYRIAQRERCAGLIWLRCGDLVRRTAPGELVLAWRSGVVHQYERGSSLLARAGHTLDRLAAANIPVVVLKGAPLAVRLYGDPLVRPIDDVDLLMSRRHWSSAAQILVDDGWEKEQGRQGWAEIYRVIDGAETYRLDMQSSIFVDHLDHLPDMIGTVGKWRCGQLAFPINVGPEVAVFLAVHLLKHQLPPLLWLIDFHTLWTVMSERERGDAISAAMSSRAHRYLAWAVACAQLLARASRGDVGAIRALGFYPSFRRDAYGMLRLVRHAASLPDKIAVLGAWTWPRPLRYDWTALSGMWHRRAGKTLARLLAAQRLYLDPRARSDIGTLVAQSPVQAPYPPS